MGACLQRFVTSPAAIVKLDSIQRERVLPKSNMSTHSLLTTQNCHVLASGLHSTRQRQRTFRAVAVVVVTRGVRKGQEQRKRRSTFRADGRVILFHQLMKSLPDIFKDSVNLCRFPEFLPLKPQTGFEIGLLNSASTCRWMMTCNPARNPLWRNRWSVARDSLEIVSASFQWKGGTERPTASQQT